MLNKPLSIAANELKSAKWDELTAGRDFAPSDAPTLELLCQWHAIVERCIEDMDIGGDISVAYTNQLEDIKALPQIGVLKQASAEIRALNKQLGINTEHNLIETKPIKETSLSVITSKRSKKARAAQA